MGYGVCDALGKLERDACTLYIGCYSLRRHIDAKTLVRCIYGTLILNYKKLDGVSLCKVLNLTDPSAPSDGRLTPRSSES